MIGEDTGRIRDSASSDQEGDHRVRSLDLSLPLPNFFIVGAPKAGTTSLHAYLRQHPQVFMSKRKEPHFFSSFHVDPDFDNFVPAIRDPRTYQDLFRESGGFVAVGESSSSYLSDARAAMLIRSVAPNARIIISLRNPVERAYSHYLMECREGRETRSFREALETDQARPKKGWGISLQYVELGLYAAQIERYITAFGRQNVLILIFEEFVRDTPAAMHEVAAFLGVDPMRFPDAAFDAVYHPFAASRGPHARWILRSRKLRLWSRRWIPQVFRRAVRDRFLFASTEKPALDDKFKRSLAPLFEADLRQLEAMLNRKLDLLRYHD